VPLGALRSTRCLEITSVPQSPRDARPNACARPRAWRFATLVRLKLPPAWCVLVAAELPAETESAVISPSKSETFDAVLDAVALAVFPAVAVADACRAPVTTAEPEAGYA
jgi:hypothetical protein